MAKELAWTNDRIEAFELRCIGHSYRNIAKRVGKNYTTIWGWAQHPDWKARYNARLGDVSAVLEINETLKSALAGLTEMIHDENLPAEVRLQAATTLLDRVGMAESTHNVRAGRETETNQEHLAQFLSDPDTGDWGMGDEG